MVNWFSREFDININPITQIKVIKLLYFVYGRYLVAMPNKLFFSNNESAIGFSYY